MILPLLAASLLTCIWGHSAATVLTFETAHAYLSSKLCYVVWQTSHLVVKAESVAVGAAEQPCKFKVNKAT